MSMSAALSNVFSFDRTRARFRSDRIEQHEDSWRGGGGGGGDGAAVTAEAMGGVEERAISPPASPTMTRRSIRRGGSTTSAAPSSLTTSSAVAPGSSGNRTNGHSLTLRSSDPSTSPEASPANSTAAASSPGSDATSPTGLSSSSSGDIETGNSPSPGVVPVVFSAAAASAGPRVGVASSTSMTLAELEEERELARRRSSLCILLAAFVLFRLWVSAIQEGDFGVMLLCLVGTSWTARWISYNREREEELDRRIANYLENQENGTNTGGGDPTLDRGELRMLSFQAQLALAIMESQRQMMQGGYGHPDGSEAQAMGVSDEAKARWTHVKFKGGGGAASSGGGSSKAGYGSLTQKDKGAMSNEDEPHCSICLCEYEDGDDTVKLPCGHLYHDECISSWTENHVKCPLCNYDLELSARGDPGALGGGGGIGAAAASEIV